MPVRPQQPDKGERDARVASLCARARHEGWTPTETDRRWGELMNRLAGIKAARAKGWKEASRWTHGKADQPARPCSPGAVSGRPGRRLPRRHRGRAGVCTSWVPGRPVLPCMTGTYHKRSPSRYGSGWVKAVMVAGMLGLPLPLPGAEKLPHGGARSSPRPSCIGSCSPAAERTGAGTAPGRGRSTGPT